MLHLTVNNFDSEVLNCKVPVVIMFYASWCGKCAMMKPVVEEIESKYRGIKFCEADVEESVSLAEKYGADIVPTFAFFENGILLAVLQGLLGEAVLEDRLNRIFRNS